MSSKEIRQSQTAQLRAVNRDQRTVDIIASTFDIDSYGTRIDQNGWDLDSFITNPVICLQHDDRGYTGSNGLPVANAIPETVRIENGKLVMRIRFPSEGTFPLADTVFNLIAEGFLRGVSVGFMPVEYEDTTEVATDGSQTTVRVYKKQELMEVSLVTIPSNDKALVLKSKSLDKDLAVVRRMTEQLEHQLQETEKTEEREIGTVKVTIRVTDLEAFTEIEKEIEKHRGYFERKQEANRESTKVLEKFFKRILKEDQPAEEAKAWLRMGEAIEAMEETKTEEIKQEETKEEVKQAEIAVEPIKPLSESSAEAPQTEAVPPQRSIPLSVLRGLPKALIDASISEAAKASLRGMPANDLPSVVDELGEKMFQSLSHS
jgi:HK97 family phage prohead protease